MGHTNWLSHGSLVFGFVSAVSGLLASASFSPTDVSAASTAIFPRRMQFDFTARRGVVPIHGSFKLSFGDDPQIASNHLLQMSGLSGFGFTSSELLFTAVRKSDFGLEYHTVLAYEGARKFVRQVRLEDCQSVMGNVSRCFVYREGANPLLQTEIFTPYAGIDLISSLLVATKMAQGKREYEDFNFIQDRNALQVRLERRATSPVETPTGKLDATLVVVRTARGAELYKVLVAESREGYFPVRLSASSEGTSLEAIAQAPTW
jgi:hypothetical protein